MVRRYGWRPTTAQGRPSRSKTYNNNTGVIALAGNYYHEFIQDKPSGQSQEDYIAGLYGIKMGYQLRDGEVTLQELATQMRIDLGE